jgi:hypothetical protein
LSNNEVDGQWLAWFENHGEEIEDWVSNEMKETRENFDFQDGSHAKWVDEQNLGLLMTFSSDDIVDLLSAWDDAHEGSFDAASFVMAKAAKVFSMLAAAARLMDLPD